MSACAGSLDLALLFVRVLFPAGEQMVEFAGAQDQLCAVLRSLRGNEERHRSVSRKVSPPPIRAFPPPRPHTLPNIHVDCALGAGRLSAAGRFHRAVRA
jgi:hypothetical protein